MPYASDAQRRYFHANKEKLEAQGVDVAEWDRASKGKKLPEKVKKEAMFKGAAAVLAAVLIRNQTRKEAAQSTYDPDKFLAELDNPTPAPVKAAPAEPVISPEDAKLMEQVRRQHDPKLRAARDREIREREEAEAAHRATFNPDPADIALRDNYEAGQKAGRWTGISQRQYEDAQRRIANMQLRQNASYNQAAKLVAGQQPAPAPAPVNAEVPVGINSPAQKNPVQQPPVPPKPPEPVLAAK